MHRDRDPKCISFLPHQGRLRRLVISGTGGDARYDRCIEITIPGASVFSHIRGGFAASSFRVLVETYPMDRCIEIAISGALISCTSEGLRRLLNSGIGVRLPLWQMHRDAALDATILERLREGSRGCDGAAIIRSVGQVLGR